MIQLIFRIFALNFSEAYDIMAEELDSLGLESDLEPSQYDYYADGKDDDKIKKIEGRVCKQLSTTIPEEDIKLKDITDLDAAIYYLEIQKNLRDNEITKPSDFDIREHRIDLSDLQVYTINPEDEGDTTMFFFTMEVDSDEF